MQTMIGYEQALSLVLSNVPKMETQRLGLQDSLGRVLSEDVVAKVDLPGTPVSLKDGYAVVSSDVQSASPDRQVSLRVLANAVAGGTCSQKVESGSAVRITTGAMIPDGADAVLAEEFCERRDDVVVCMADAHPGRNILPKGSDIEAASVLLQSGRRLLPPDLGLMAAGGVDEVRVFRPPRVSVLSTGDEVVAPGKHLGEGKLFASNLVEIGSWISLLGMQVDTGIAPDDRDSISRAVEKSLADADVLITTGGAWTSERDLLVSVLDGLGWQGIFHRVRMGPGKGVAFGLLDGKAIFCLPGGPLSNEMALLQLALPGVRRMQGMEEGLFPMVRCVLSESVSGQGDWTQFMPAFFEREDKADSMSAEHGALAKVRPYKMRSRLQSMAQKQALIKVPEGVERIQAGETIEVQSVRQMGFGG